MEEPIHRSIKDVEDMFKTIREDIQSVFQRDPAARSTLEILINYPGLHAVWGHRLAHWLWRRNFKLVARCLSGIYDTNNIYYSEELL